MSFIKRLFASKSRPVHESPPRPPSKAGPVLDVLDSCAKDFTFPMLDNGYVYLAATRLSAYKSERDWALVIEIFGFSPRAGSPDLTIYTFGSQLSNRSKSFVSDEARQKYLAANPNNESRSVFPIENDDWQDAEILEYAVSEASVNLRGTRIQVPGSQILRSVNIHPEEDRPLTFEVCRYLSHHHRDLVLATEVERRHNIPAELEQVLLLEDWIHPDLADGELPGQTLTFQQIQDVLISGEIGKYEPPETGNTHWKNWPEGGIL